VNTDDRNLVEFSFARTVSRRSLFDISWLRRAAAAMGAERPSVDGAVDWERVRRQRLAIYTVADVTTPIERGTPEAELLRARAHATYLVGWLREAVKLFQQQSHPPEGAVETALFAEGLAEGGDPAAVPYLQALVAVEPVEARAAAARLALRMGRPEQARDALVSAFVQYRRDPWPTQSSMRRALRLAEEIATVRPDLAPSLFDATSEPFAAGAVGQQRRFTRVLLTAVPGMESRCREAFAALEPFVPWTEELLRRRVACYGSQGPHAARARAELAEFRSHVTPQASPLPPSPSPSAP